MDSSSLRSPNRSSFVPNLNIHNATRVGGGEDNGNDSTAHISTVSSIAVDPSRGDSYRYGNWATSNNNTTMSGIGGSGGSSSSGSGMGASSGINRGYRNDGVGNRSNFSTHARANNTTAQHYTGGSGSTSFSTIYGGDSGGGGGGGGNRNWSASPSHRHGGPPLPSTAAAAAADDWRTRRTDTNSRISNSNSATRGHQHQHQQQQSDGYGVPYVEYLRSRDRYLGGGGTTATNRNTTGGYGYDDDDDGGSGYRATIPRWSPARTSPYSSAAVAAVAAVAAAAAAAAGTNAERWSSGGGNGNVSGGGGGGPSWRTTDTRRPGHQQQQRQFCYSSGTDGMVETPGRARHHNDDHMGDAMLPSSSDSDDDDDDEEEDSGGSNNSDSTGGFFFFPSCNEERRRRKKEKEKEKKKRDRKRKEKVRRAKIAANSGNSAHPTAFTDLRDFQGPFPGSNSNNDDDERHTVASMATNEIDLDAHPVVPGALLRRTNKPVFQWNRHPSHEVVLELLRHRGLYLPRYRELVNYHMAELFLHFLDVCREGSYFVFYSPNKWPKERFLRIRLLPACRMSNPTEPVPQLVMTMHESGVALVEAIPLDFLVGVTTTPRAPCFRPFLESPNTILGCREGRGHRARMPVDGCFTLWFYDRVNAVARSVDLLTCDAKIYDIWTKTFMGLVSVNSSSVVQVGINPATTTAPMATTSTTAAMDIGGGGGGGGGGDSGAANASRIEELAMAAQQQAEMDYEAAQRVKRNKSKG